MSTNNAELSGCTVGTANLKIVDRIHVLKINDRKMNVRDIVRPVCVSCERVHHIVNDYLDIKMLAGKIGCRNCSQQKSSCDAFDESLHLPQQNPSNCRFRFVPVDEKWIHYLHTRDQRTFQKKVC